VLEKGGGRQGRLGEEGKGGVGEVGFEEVLGMLARRIEGEGKEGQSSKEDGRSVATQPQLDRGPAPRTRRAWLPLNVYAKTSRRKSKKYTSKAL
jgi:hypothetical protein